VLNCQCGGPIQIQVTYEPAGVIYGQAKCRDCEAAAPKILLRSPLPRLDSAFTLRDMLAKRFHETSELRRRMAEVRAATEMPSPLDLTADA
jgi:hypothetical protein